MDLFLKTWIKNLKIVGAKNAWQKQNKKSFSCLKFQRTNEEGNTNAHNAEKNLGCLEEDHQLNQFTDQNCDQKLINLEKNYVFIIHHLV